MKITNDILKDVTFTITVPKLFRFRVWLGGKIIVLGVCITGMTPIVKVE